MYEYGREDEQSVEKIRQNWTDWRGKDGARNRAWCARHGTPHEIIMATLQHKPVLFVSPPVSFPTLR